MPTRTLALLGTASALAIAALAGPAPAVAEDIVLNMAAPDWPPTRFMQEEADRSYTAPSGNNVRLQIDFIPWPSFYERVAASLTSGEQKYQMLVTDSQWLGSFIEGGYYMDLTGLIAEDEELQAIMQDLHPALVSAYSTYPHIPVTELQEYPDPNANYYGFPQMPDTYVTWYREDLFCNETESADFEAEYGAPLPCTYEDWEDVDWERFDQIGTFFRRSAGDALGDGTADDEFYGIAYQAGKGYDFSTMQINAFIWQYGGSIWDESTEPEGQAEGVVNSDVAVEAFEHYLSMLEHMPPAWQTGQMDIFQIQELYLQGKVAAIINWVGLAEPVLDPETSTVSEVSAFARAPGLRQEDGSISRWANIGGQPFVLTTWNSDTVVREALDFVKWWESEEVQKKFAANGGQSGLRSVMELPEYNDYRPWNRAHVESLDWQKDVWHIPEFFELLTQQQEEFDKAITGQIDAREALDEVAEFQQEVLEDAGRIE
ncbi:MAG: extracellular solute-binding protein [Azospirillaceae bacterium]